MTTTISTSQQIDLEVAELARRHGLEGVLPLVGDLTERLFPMARAIDVELVADDEQPDQRSIFFNVRGLDIEPRLGSELHWQWAAELQHICPGPRPGVVGLGTRLGGLKHGPANVSHARRRVGARPDRGSLGDLP